jgi:CheY-like chemotaxis protein
MKTVRLLLVDDNEDNLEMFRVVLSQRYDVSSYACPQDALAAVEAAKPDLVLLDIGMRPIDGLQCLKAIRERPGCGNIPAIALTAYARDVDREAFLAAGFQAIVTKPILDDEELFGPITAVLALTAAPSDRLSDEPRGDESGPSHRASVGAWLDRTYRMTA